VLTLHKGASIDIRPLDRLGYTDPTLTIESGVDLIDGDGTTSLLNAGTIVYRGTSDQSPMPRIENEGTVTIESGNLTTTSYRQTSGQTTLNVGQLTAPAVDIEGGTLFGTGLIQGDLINRGTVRPWPALLSAAITVSGNYTQTSEGVLELEIGKDAHGEPQNGRLTVGGTATLGGAMHAIALDDYAPTLGDEFHVVQSDEPFAGSFDEMTQPALPSGLMWTGGVESQADPASETLVLRVEDDTPTPDPARRLSIPTDLEAVVGETITVPINIDDADGVWDATIEVHYDRSCLKPRLPLGVAAGSVWRPGTRVEIVSSNPGEGTLELAIGEGSPEMAHGWGSLVEIEFFVYSNPNGTGPYDAFFGLTSGSLNGEPIPVDWSIGLLTVLGEQPPANQPPTTTGIADIGVELGTAASTIDLFAAFDDAEDGAASLAYSTTASADDPLLADVDLDTDAGTLTLHYASGAVGTMQVTVTAADSEGETVEATFDVTVAEAVESLVVEALPLMDVAHAASPVAAVNGKLYVWSGYTNDGPSVGGRTRAMEIYDPTTNTWSRGSDIPSERNSPGSFVLDGLLYTIGGEKSPSGSFTRTVYRYDPAVETWTLLNDLPYISSAVMTTVVDGTAYMMGGTGGYSPVYSHVFAYDQATDTWSPRAEVAWAVCAAGMAGRGGKV